MKPFDGIGIHIEWLCPNRVRFREYMTHGNWFLGWEFGCRRDETTFNPRALVRLLGLQVAVGFAFSHWRAYKEALQKDKSAV